MASTAHASLARVAFITTPRAKAVLSAAHVAQSVSAGAGVKKMIVVAGTASVIAVGMIGAVAVGVKFMRKA